MSDKYNYHQRYTILEKVMKKEKLLIGITDITTFVKLAQILSYIYLTRRYN